LAIRCDMVSVGAKPMGKISVVLGVLGVLSVGLAVGAGRTPLLVGSAVMVVGAIVAGVVALMGVHQGPHAKVGLALGILTAASMVLLGLRDRMDTGASVEEPARTTSTGTR
jgi:hypothetical protein